MDTAVALRLSKTSATRRDLEDVSVVSNLYIRRKSVIASVSSGIGALSDIGHLRLVNHVAMSPDDTAGVKAKSSNTLAQPANICLAISTSRRSGFCLDSSVALSPRKRRNQRASA